MKIKTYESFLNFSRTELSSLEVLLRKLCFSDEGLLDVPLQGKEWNHLTGTDLTWTNSPLWLVSLSLLPTKEHYLDISLNRPNQLRCSTLCNDKQRRQNKLASKAVCTTHQEKELVSQRKSVCVLIGLK